ncbi:hypothetical protein LZT07_13795 [Vibrio fluvialis]|uniref:DUF6950 family protein n=1 Tax=Vibrio fluvialis TaxID=676 RepID=UPI001F2332E1|nr:hypothetical protein [Vibrio fluvialis]MCE7638393.1 hypothetical protein [Vibrio fluvialis]
MSKLELLNAFIKNYQDRTFETGVNDCALFASDWAKTLTGLDLATRFRGKYRSDLGSARLIKKLGYRGLEDLVCSELDRIGHRLENPLQAERGDIAWVQGPTEKVCGIVGGTGVFVLGLNGLVSLPVTKVLRAWSIDYLEVN